MTDPLAHLYAETGAGDPDDDVELPVRETSLEELTAERGADEDLSESDLAELVLLVKARLDGDGLDDQEAAELGLGDLVEDDDGDLSLALNATGRAVLRRIIADGHPEIRFEGHQ